MDAQRKFITVTRTVRVELGSGDVMRILREECGAPSNADVELSEYGATTVTWSTVEADD